MITCVFSVTSNFSEVLHYQKVGQRCSSPMPAPALRLLRHCRRENEINVFLSFTVAVKSVIRGGQFEARKFYQFHTTTFTAWTRKGYYPRKCELV